MKRVEVMEIDVDLPEGATREDIEGSINLHFGELVLRSDIIPEGSKYRPELRTSAWELVSPKERDLARRELPRRQDREATLALLSSIHGATQPCPHCGGYGRDFRTAFNPCGYCAGHGHVRTGDDEELSPGADCPDCGMSGVTNVTIGAGVFASVHRAVCQRCRGKGVIPPEGDLRMRPELPPPLPVEKMSHEHRRMIAAVAPDQLRLSPSPQALAATTMRIGSDG